MEHGLAQLTTRTTVRKGMAGLNGLTIALTYDLKSDYDPNDPHLLPETFAEFAEDETIVAIVEALISLGHKSIRVGNITHLVKALAEQKHAEWDLVFNITEGVHGSARVAQVPSLLEAFGIPFVFSDARTMAVMHDKALTKVLLREAGIATSPSMLIKGGEPFDDLTAAEWKAMLKFKDEEEMDVFVKLNAEGTSKGLYDNSRATTGDNANRAVRRLRTQFPRSDILVERFLDGREFSVSIAGTGNKSEVLGVTEMLWPPDCPPFCTWYAKTDGEEGKDWAERAVLSDKDAEVAKTERVALQAWSALGCRDGGRIDLRSKGSGITAEPHVLEVNAIAGLRPGWSDLPLAAHRNGLEYIRVIEKFIESAKERILPSEDAPDSQP